MIYVSSLPFNTNKQDLVKLFEKFGSVSAVEIFADWQNPTHEPYAYVTLTGNNLEQVESDAIEELDGIKIGRTHLRVHKKVTL